MQAPQDSLGFPGGLYGKESACKAGDLGSIPRLGRSPGEGTGNPLQYALPGEFHGQRSLTGYSPWGPKELDVTERLHFHFQDSLVPTMHGEKLFFQQLCALV